MELITSPQNAKFKLVNRLRGKRSREQESRFVIEYERDLQRALQQGYQIDFLLLCPELAEKDPAEFESVKQKSHITPKLIKRLTYRENPTGIIAVLHSKRPKGLVDLQRAEPGCIIVLVDLRVPGNIGALMRTADAAGIDAVILVDCALDLYNPNIIRSSTGACFGENIYRLSAEATSEYLKRRDFQVFAADANSKTSIYDEDLRPKTALVLGAEDRGLSEFWREHCDRLVSIPMTGQLIDSLNVSVTGAIFMYEMRRQSQFV